jgi:hypothetical protein
LELYKNQIRFGEKCMIEPHVNSLRYKLVLSNEVSYENCSPIEHENDIYVIKLFEGILTCYFKKHFDSIDLAKAELEKLLRTWEIDSAIKNGRRELKFVYVDADIIDRNPVPAGSVNILAVSCSSTVSISGTVTLHVKRGKYPPMPTDFEVNPDVETLWHRYEIYLDGREQLLSMGYFCLSFVESLAGGQRYLIENKFFIKREVLDKLGELTSSRGTHLTARKGKGHNFQPLTNQEEIWIEECIKKIVHRVGEHQKNNSSLVMITMNDLPKE